MHTAKPFFLIVPMAVLSPKNLCFLFIRALISEFTVTYPNNPKISVLFAIISFTFFAFNKTGFL